MTVSWLALAAALLLVPVPVAAALRVRALAGRAQSALGPAARGERVLVPPAPVPSGPERLGPERLGPERLGPALGVGAGLALVVTAALAFGPGLGLAAGVAALTGGYLARRTRAARRTRRRRDQLLAAVRLLVSEVEAGARPADALAAAGGVAAGFREQFAAAARAAGAGDPVAERLIATVELAPIGHAWRLSEAGGAPLGEVLAGVAADLAARDETRRAVAAAVAGARSSAGLLAGLPLLGIGLGAAMGARPLAFLTGSPAGHATACAGVVLEALGLVWTQQLVRRAEAG